MEELEFRVKEQGFVACNINPDISGGAPPFTWLVDGVPVVTGETRRQAIWEKPGRGFARLSVIDAKGATASAAVRIE